MLNVCRTPGPTACFKEVCLKKVGASLGGLFNGITLV